MALSANESLMARDLGFEPAVCELVKAGTPRRLRPFRCDGVAVGFEFRVKDGEEAERLMQSLQPQLFPLGYRAFWTKLHESNGAAIGDAVVVLHATDPFAILDAALPDAGNHGLTTDDIRAHLRGWEGLCRLEIVGASRDWVAVVFHTLPDDLCRFAEDLALFCPDIADFYMGRNKPGAAERQRAAAALCPTLSDAFWQRHDAKTRDVLGDDPAGTEFRDLLRQDTLSNVQQLAYELREKKYLFLWWD